MLLEFLSGGIDSSLVQFYLKNSEKNIITIGFNERSLVI